MKKIFFFTIAFLCAVLSLAQNQSRAIYIDVIYPNTTVKDTISIEYQHNGWSLTALEIFKLEDSLTNNHFHINPKTEDKFLYFNLRGKSKYLLINYLAEPGDSIQVYVQPDKFIFRGRGSEKYQCRYDMDKIKKVFPHPDIRKNYNSIGNELVKDSLFYTNYIPDAHSKVERYYHSTKSSEEVLHWYKTKLSEDVYNILRANLLAMAENEILKDFIFMFNGFKKDSNYAQKRNIQDSLITIYLNRKANDFSKIPDTLLAYSQEYVSYNTSLYNMYEDEFGDSFLKFGNPSATNNGVHGIKNNFKGLVRDRIVTQYLIKRFVNLPNISEQIDQALKFVENSKCRDLLVNLKKTNANGSNAYSFQLPDFNGKIRTLEEFKGKVILMDFWFTGCAACRVMAEDLKPVVEYFKNHKNVVFISVSADDDLKTWKNSVIKEIYTNKYGVDLFTQGQGTDHPIIKNFKVMLYPTLIMIGKDGKVITTSVIKPQNERDRKKLISFIEKFI